MIIWHWVQHHRLLSVLILAFVIVSSAGGTAWALVFRTVSSPVGLREALRIYRREQTDKMLTTLRNHLPAPGVYTYRTTGGESLSLMGVARSFPSTTSMIVEDGNCATVNWVPITQHTETITECPGADGALQRAEALHHRVHRRHRYDLHHRVPGDGVPLAAARCRPGPEMGRHVRVPEPGRRRCCWWVSSSVRPP